MDRIGKIPVQRYFLPRTEPVTIWVQPGSTGLPAGHLCKNCLWAIGYQFWRPPRIPYPKAWLFHPLICGLGPWCRLRVVAPHLWKQHMCRTQTIFHRWLGGSVLHVNRRVGHIYMVGHKWRWADFWAKKRGRWAAKGPDLYLCYFG